MLLTATATLFFLGRALGQDCPDVHVFGARETTVGPGFGSSASVVDAVVSANPGATSEAIEYPACGGQASCGGVSYEDSASQGADAVAEAVNGFNSRCPDSQMVLVGYSQGGQIMDAALCDGQISAGAAGMVAAAIFMGDPRFNAAANLSYQIGTCQAQGFAAVPNSYSCQYADKIQSYCDSQDPYCCTGNDENHHQQYGTIYGQDAQTFIQGKLGGA